MKKQITIATYILYAMNIAFWLGIVVYYWFIEFAGNSSYLLIKILLLFEPLVFAISLLGYLKRIRFIYLVTLIFLIFNSILSLTDEVGAFDIASFLLNIGLLILLLVQWRTIAKK
jgi:hypothetical protein